MLFEKSGRKVQISTTSSCSESTSTSQETRLTLYCKFYYQLLPCSFLSRTSIPPLRDGFPLSYSCPLFLLFTRTSTFRESFPVQAPCNSHGKGLRCNCSIIYPKQFLYAHHQVPFSLLARGTLKTSTPKVLVPE